MIFQGWVFMNNEKLEIVPKLRFPEFLDEQVWEEKKLDDIFSGKKGQGLSKSNIDKNGQNKCILYGELYTKYSETIDNVISRTNLNIGVKSKAGDLLVPCSTTTTNIDLANVTAINENNVLLGGDISILRFKKNGNSVFFAYYLTHPKKFDLAKYGQGSTIVHLYYNHFKKMSLYVPAFVKEQEKIAACLTSLDELITTQTKKIESLKTHKKGLMQQLFPAEEKTTPKCRFSEFTGEWEKTKLGEKEISDFIKDRVALNQLDIKTYISTENLLPNYSGIKIATKLPPSGSFVRFKKKDILISNIRPYLKKVWQATINGNSSNDVIVIRAKTKVIDSFLVCILKNDNFINYVMKNAKGTKMPRGDLSSIKKYSLFYPKKREQQKIADCLSSLDELITLQTQKINHLKTHKKGLMQQLFPNTDEESG